jgi:hypothetical protein
MRISIIISGGGRPVACGRRGQNSLSTGSANRSIVRVCSHHPRSRRDNAGSLPQCLRQFYDFMEPCLTSIEPRPGRAQHGSQLSQGRSLVTASMLSLPLPATTSACSWMGSCASLFARSSKPSWRNSWVGRHAGSSRRLSFTAVQRAERKLAFSFTLSTTPRDSVTMRLRNSE